MYLKRVNTLQKLVIDFGLVQISCRNQDSSLRLLSTCKYLYIFTVCYTFCTERFYLLETLVLISATRRRSQGMYLLHNNNNTPLCLGVQCFKFCYVVVKTVK